MVNGVNIGYKGNLIYIVNENSQEEDHMNIYWKEAFLEITLLSLKKTVFVNVGVVYTEEKDILKHTKHR